MSEIALAAGDQLTPSFERATVADAMRHGVIDCAPSVPLRAVARIMATNHVHCVVVTGREVDRTGHIGDRAWGIVTDFDVVRAAARADDLVAAEAASIDLPTVGPDEPLANAARLLAEHAAGHLVVVDPQSGARMGVVSTLDVAGNLAWARG